MLPRVPLGRIVNNLCFLSDKVFSIGCIPTETFQSGRPELKSEKLPKIIVNLHYPVDRSPFMSCIHV